MVAKPVPPHSLELAPLAASPKPGKFKWIALFLLIVGGFAGWQFLKPKPPDLCQEALNGAAAFMQANQLAQAKTQALGAVARCTGESQERAKTVLKAAEAAQAADDSCGKALRLADSQIADGRLKLASRTLDAQPGICLNREEATERKQRIDANRVAAGEKLNTAQTQLTEGRTDQAKDSVDQAERLDRDNPELAKIRRDIAKPNVVVRADAPAAPASPVPAFEPAQPKPMDKAVILAFRSAVSPAEAYAGQQIQLNSAITVLAGKSPGPIEEELEIVDSQGRSWGRPIRKAVGSAVQGGELKPTFTIPIGNGWDPGTYGLRATLYVNGVVAQRDDSSLRFRVVPAPNNNSPGPGGSREGESPVNAGQVECSVLVRAGQRALSNKSYDEAMQSAQEALNAFANCAGAQQLFQSARQAKDKARQSAVIQ